MRTVKLLLLLGLAQFLQAQGISPKLDSLLRLTLEQQQDALNVKALSAAMQFPDGSVWTHAAGISSNFPAQDADTAMVFGIGSVTKTVTAACILQMADEGLLNLDDKIYQWLDTIPYVSQNVTIRHLLRHQSGIFDVLYAPGFQDVMLANMDSLWALSDVVYTFINPPYFQPGASFRYCNTNYILLGMIVEKIAGKPYYEEYRERFFEPLGLEAIVMRPFEPFQNPIAHPWLDLDGNGSLDNGYNLIINWHSFDAATGPAGSYYSTSSDVARWIKAFAGGQFHSPDIMAAAKTTVSTTFPAGTKYGLGLMERNFLGNKAYGHGGDFVYCGSAWYFPEKDLSIAVLNNDASKNSWQIAPAVQALLKTYIDCLQVMDAPVLADQNAILISPNPFQDQVHISCPGRTLEWVLANALGQTVRSGQSDAGSTSGETALSGLGDLPDGVYFLHGTADGVPMGARKLVKGNG